MTLQSLFCLSLAALTLGCKPTAPAAPVAEPQVSVPAAERGSAFAFDMFRALAAERQGDITFSPQSLESVLSLLLDIAQGRSQAELGAAIKAQDTPPMELIRMTQQANALFVADDARTVPGKHPLTPVPFATDRAQAVNAINEWCRHTTKGLIPKLVTTADITPLTRLVALNALYLKGTWLHPFDPKRTREGVFHTAGGARPATFMTAKDSFRLASGEDWDAVALFYAPKYGGEPACFIGILPRGDARAFAQGLTREKYNAIRRALAQVPAKQGVRVTLPRMQMDTGCVSLRRAMQSCGISQCFKDIELSVLPDEKDMYLDDVIQRCRIEVTEEGTVAAAATAASVKSRSLSPSITFDRPFLWAIGDLSSGATPSFLGLCEGGTAPNKLTQSEALDKAQAALIQHNKEAYEKLKAIDHGDYYTVTPDLPPYMVGGGWSVDLDSASGEIRKIYFTE